MELVVNGGLTGLGVMAFLGALALSGLVVVPLLDRIIARFSKPAEPVELVAPTGGIRRRRDDEWYDSDLT
jgi:hypothetical protein